MSDQHDRQLESPTLEIMTDLQADQLLRSPPPDSTAPTPTTTSPAAINTIIASVGPQISITAIPNPPRTDQRPRSPIRPPTPVPTGATPLAEAPQDLSLTSSTRRRQEHRTRRAPSSSRSTTSSGTRRYTAGHDRAHRPRTDSTHPHQHIPPLFPRTTPQPQHRQVPSAPHQHARPIVPVAPSPSRTPHTDNINQSPQLGLRTLLPHPPHLSQHNHLRRTIPQHHPYPITAPRPTQPMSHPRNTHTPQRYTLLLAVAYRILSELAHSHQIYLDAMDVLVAIQTIIEGHRPTTTLTLPQYPHPLIQPPPQPPTLPTAITQTMASLTPISPHTSANPQLPPLQPPTSTSGPSIHDRLGPQP